MNLSIDFLTFLLDKAILSQYFWLPVIGLSHLAIFLIFHDKKISMLGALVGLFAWIAIGHPLIESIQNAGVDSFLELRAPDGREAIFWLYSILGSTLPSLDYVMLWAAIAFIYSLFWTICSIFLSSKKLFIFNGLCQALSIIFLILWIPFVSIAEKKSAFELASNQFNLTYAAFNSDDSAIKILSSNKGLPVFLYIGESTGSMHMQIYGYPRMTTPKLNLFLGQNQDNFIKVPNAWSTHTHTIPSLLDAFSVKVKQSKLPDIASIFQRTAHPLIPLLAKANIDTHIIANHVHDDFLSIVFDQAKTLVVPKIDNGSLDPFKELNTFDHEVLQQALAMLPSKKEIPKALYIFHSYAGHGDYKSFIPPAFHNNVDDLFLDIPASAVMGNISFKDVDHIESYDSAVSYIDDNLVTSLNFIKELDSPMVFIYFPDHGESVYTRRGHESSKFISEMAQIPLFVYFNDLAIKNNPDLFHLIQDRLRNNKFATLSQIPSLLSEVLGVEIVNQLTSESLIKCKIGLINCQDEFLLVREVTDNKSIVRTQTSQQLRSDMIDSTDSATDHYNLMRQIDGISDVGVCYHRSNTAAKAIRGLSVTNCLEFDVMVNNQDVDIYHPPAKKTGFTFETMMAIAQNRNATLWIDGKNIQASMECQALKNKLILYKTTSTNFFIEFPSSIFDVENKPEICINELKMLGFSTSYYVPQAATECALDIKQGIDFNSSNSCEELQNRILWVAESGYFTDISFDYSAYEAVRAIKQSKDLRWNIWGIDINTASTLPLDTLHLIIPSNQDPNTL